MSGGRKNDSQKIRLDLLSRIWLWGTAAVLTFGAKKYAADNWRLGLSQRRLIGGAMRHLTQYLDGEDMDFDPECAGCQAGECGDHSGFCHLYNASCMIMFAAELRETRPELDDRYKVDPAAMRRAIASMQGALSPITAPITEEEQGQTKSYGLRP